MVKIEFDIPEYMADFLRAGNEAYEKAFAGKSYLFLEMVLSEFVVSRLSALVDREQLLKMQDEPEALFAFAAEYLRTKSIEFEQGKADPGWIEETEQ